MAPVVKIIGQLRCACAITVLDCAHAKQNITALQEISNNRKLFVLEEVFWGPQGIPWVSIESLTAKEATWNMSLVGGHGVNTACNCKGKFDNIHCECTTNNAFCNSKCHWGHSCGMNHEKWFVSLKD